MSLGPGVRLGPYEIVSALGAGGMGEVYRARDTKLERDVAIKVLPDVFASDPERLARFDREAKTLAALNHPHISHIYALTQAVPHEPVGRSADIAVTTIVMELVEGETLAERIARGPIPLDEALPIATQIAAALEAAHEQGIIHRDLKPANIKLTPNGDVKVLDFGLAKLTEASDVASGFSRKDQSLSPTITSPALVTGVGMLLGTAAYMAPDQAKGKAADKRSDIWAFGCVLYEMLTGRRAFPGEDVAETLAAVIRAEPDLSSLAAGARSLVRACLQKDPRQRLQAIGDTRLLWPDAAVTADTTDARPPMIPWGVAVVAAVAAIALAIVHFRAPSPGVPPLVRFDIAMPEGVVPMRGAVIAPDGQRLVFPATGSDGVRRLWLRRLDSSELRIISGTEGSAGTRPFWSPDSQVIAFEVNGQLKKVDVAGGPVQTICDVPLNVLSGSWNRDGVIVFGNNAGPLMRVSSAGGTATPVTTERGSFPYFFPDGRRFLYVSNAEVLRVGTLDADLSQAAREPLVRSAAAPALAPSTNPDVPFLLFVREGTLFAQPFDLRTTELTGEAVVIAEQVGSFNTDSFFSVSETGALVVRSGDARLARLTWFDRGGISHGAVTSAIEILEPALSPDGTRVALTGKTPRNIHVQDLRRGVLSRLTFGDSRAASWSPDGDRIAFMTGDGTRLMETVSTGGGVEREITAAAAAANYSTHWSPDGEYLLYQTNDATSSTDLFAAPIAGGKPFPVVQTRAVDMHGRFSPDGRWIAYVSSESGRAEVYVRPFNPPGVAAREGQWQVSNAGGVEPRWRRDGKELFFVAQDSIVAVDIALDPGFAAGPPRILFQRPPVYTDGWDVAPDGQRFLLPVLESTRDMFSVVLNWPALMAQATRGR